MAERIPQSATIRIPLQAYLSSDHVSPATGKTIAITISKNGAAYGNPSGGATNAVEIGSGSYYVDLSTTDTGTAGPLFVLGTAATIDNVVAIYDVVNANTGGLAALPNTAVTTNASLLTSGTGTDQISVTSGRIDLGKILGTASAGQAGSVGIDWAQVANKTSAVDLTNTTIKGIDGGVTVSGYASGQQPSVSVWATVLEVGVTTLQGLQYGASSMAGVLSGAATTTVGIQAIGNAGTNRITATVDADGNRTVVVLS